MVKTMTIAEAISHIDSLKPNNYSPEDKIAWLSTLDGVIKNEIIDTHEGSDNVDFKGYNTETSLDTVLIVPAPYDEIYVKWLEAQIDYNNGETSKYVNSMTMYNSAYSTFERFYNRTNMPKGKSFKFF